MIYLRSKLKQNVTKIKSKSNQAYGADTIKILKGLEAVEKTECILETPMTDPVYIWCLR